MKRLALKLVLEERVRVPDGAGGFTSDWAALGTLWGALERGTGQRAAAEEHAAGRARYRISVRAVPFGSASRPVAGQRFRMGARTFEVMSVLDNGDARYLTCLVEEEVAS